MSIAGISSNFSALSTTDVQATEQYDEDAQLLAQTLQTQSLQSPALLNPALSDTTDLLNSVLPVTLANTSSVSENGSETNGGALAALDQELTSAPSQAASFGIAAPSAAAPANASGANTPSGNTTQPGTLLSLIEEIQQQAQQAYTAAQQGYPDVNATTTLAAG
jgi:hypothetical protein